MKKRIAALAMALAMVLGIAAAAAGGEKNISVVPMQMTINGQAVTPTKSDGTPAEVFAYDGATYVPLRYLSELLGIGVEWDQNDSSTAKLVGENLKIPAAPAAGALKDGAYTGEGKGFGGAVTATVTVSGGKLTACALEGKGETPSIGGAALDTLKEQVLAAGSGEIDGVTGATFTSNGVKAAVAAALAQASGAAVEEKTGDVLQSAETDVLVIGGGGAGLSAALSAAQNGAKVVLVEKLSTLGGNTFRCGGAFNTYDPEGQKDIPMTDALSTTVEKLLAHKDVSKEHAQLKAEVKKQWDEYKKSGRTNLFDSPEWHALQTIDAGDYEGNVTMVRTLTANTLDTLHWLGDNGVKWSDQVSTVVGALWNRSHQTLPKASGAEIVAALENTARAAGVQIYLDTKAESLVNEGGKVTGAVITNAKGETVTVKAGKGVILATGGFAANVEMRTKYNKQWENIDKLGTNNTPGATGDGITMGLSVDANLVGMGWIQLMPLNSVTGGGISGYVNSTAFVNKEGKRFVAEDERRDVLAAGALAQTDQMFYGICDSKEALSRMSQEALDGQVQYKMISRGETLAELAETIGVPAKELEKTVSEFNKLVKADKPDQFGRRTWENTIEAGPFYAVCFSPCVHHTMGGLEINPNAEVLNTKGQVIAGLYAAGEVTGGIHGTNRVGGNAVPDALCFGKIAGANAAAK